MSQGPLRPSERPFSPKAQPLPHRRGPRPRPGGGAPATPLRAAGAEKRHVPRRVAARAHARDHVNRDVTQTTIPRETLRRVA